MSYYDKHVEISDMMGKTITQIIGGEKYDDEIKFYTSDGYVYTMYHDQDCCENVSVEDVTGDLQSLVGHTVVEASETSQENPHASEHGTWTFYKINTNNWRGGVCIRWNGESNGYYSENVSIRKEAYAAVDDSTNEFAYMYI